MKFQTFTVENHYITIPNRPPIHESQCTVMFNIDDVSTTTQGFYDAFYEWIATCCVQSFSHATLQLLAYRPPYSLLTMKMDRGNKIKMYEADTLCYTIGRASAVVRDHSGAYDESFSKKLERVVAAKKQLQLKDTTQQNMHTLLVTADYEQLQRYADTIDLHYMPKEKARHFIKQMVIACEVLTTIVKPYIKMPSLQLLRGKKGTNGFFDEATETIGIHYKYDRDLAMQLALFHEYGHFIDKRRQKNTLYKKKRQHLYEMLLEMPTLKAIQQDRSLTDDYRHYLLSIDEVMARLFESTVYYMHYGVCSEKAFLFNEREIKEASKC